MGLGALGHIETSLEGCGTPEQGWGYRGEWDMLGQTRGGVLGGTGHTGTGLGGVGTGLEGLGWRWGAPGGCWGSGDVDTTPGKRRGGHDGVLCVASSTHHLPAAWQSPYLNVFKHFRVEEWKRSHKEGDVTTVMVTKVPGMALTQGGQQNPTMLCSCRTRR